MRAAEYMRVSSITRQLNAEGVSTPQNGPKWHTSTVFFIFHAPLYWGHSEWGKRSRSGMEPVETQAPRLIDRETFEATRETYCAQHQGAVDQRSIRGEI